MKKKAAAEKAEELFPIKGGSIQIPEGFIPPPPIRGKKKDLSGKNNDKQIFVRWGSVRIPEGFIPPPPPPSKVRGAAKLMKEDGEK